MPKEYFKNKYRVATTRLKDWDYSWPGLYYVTICNKNKICYFATIKNTFGPQIRNLPSIIRGFKAASRNKINSKFDNNFQWQPRYYEHIIRNEQDYARIKDYIANNPINWQNDKNNPQNFKHDQEI